MITEVVAGIPVDDFDEHLAALAARGLVPDSTETIPGVVRKAWFVDPAGNTITLGQPGA
jgi:predicted enzyme related to lactoylglutathione lyase